MDDGKTAGWIMAALAGTAVAGFFWSRGGCKPNPQGHPGNCDCHCYAHLFREYGAPLGIPVRYLHALACRESSCDPLDRKGPAWGLMQVTEVVRCSEARIDGKPGVHTREELLNPRISVFLCTRILGKTIRTLNSLGVTTNWNNKRWVGLVTAGWNAGYSMRGGLGRVIKYLVKRGWEIGDIDIDVVYQHAQSAGATRFLWEFPKRRKWWHSVVRLYFQTR